MLDKATVLVLVVVELVMRILLVLLWNPNTVSFQIKGPLIVNLGLGFSDSRK